MCLIRSCERKDRKKIAILDTFLYLCLMKNERVIFLTNDDGWRAKGFAAAIEVARRFGRVIAIAPELPQSGKSQAITIYDPLYLKKDTPLDPFDIVGYIDTL